MAALVEIQALFRYAEVIFLITIVNACWFDDMITEFLIVFQLFLIMLFSGFSLVPSAIRYIVLKP